MTFRRAPDACDRIASILPDIGPGDLLPADIGICAVLPSWVDECGICRGPGTWFVLLVPGTGANAGGLEQAVLALPAGRYLVEIYGVDERRWMSVESAAAPPLVIGVPQCAGEAIVRVRAVD